MHELNELSLEQKIRTATEEVLTELGLSERVKVDRVEPKQDSDRYAVGLVEQTGPEESAFPFFYIDPTEVLTANQGTRITTETLKPFILREVQKIFPE